MADLPDDIIVEPHVVNGEPEVFLSIEGSTFHLRPDEAHQIGAALVQAVEALREQAAVEAIP